MEINSTCGLVIANAFAINLTLVLFVIQIGILAVSGLFLLISLTNLWGLERLGKFPAPKRAPFVSILVPARNEEKNIKSCVESLLAQDLGLRETGGTDWHGPVGSSKLMLGKCGNLNINEHVTW